MNRKRSKPKIDRTMPMVHPNAAAIDVGATMHMAAVSADRTPEPVRSFGTFTTDLHRLVNWFKECGVETVVMESTSVYWIPIFELRDARGFIAPIYCSLATQGADERPTWGRRSRRAVRRRVAGSFKPLIDEICNQW